MPDNHINERLIRIRAIDEKFASEPGKSFKPEEIINYVKSRISDENYNRFKLIRDINFLKKERPFKILEKKCLSDSKKGRKITKYGYKEEGDSLYNIQLTKDDKNLIKEILESLDLKGIQTKGIFWKFNINYGKEFTGNHKPIISFTKNPTEYKINNILAKLYDNIKQKNVISFRMHSRNYPYEKERYNVHPWYLREYNRRWYLFGLDIKKNKIERYALDRIEGSVIQLKKKYIAPNQSIDQILSTIIGVSLTDTEPINIVFWVSDVSADYVARKKMHSSQEEIYIPEDSPFYDMIKHRPHGKFFKMTCENNYELRREMISFNSELIVLSPESFRQEIKENIERMIENYKL